MLIQMVHRRGEGQRGRGPVVSRRHAGESGRRGGGYGPALEKLQRRVGNDQLCSDSVAQDSLVQQVRADRPFVVELRTS